MATLHPNNITGFFNIPIYQRLFTWKEEQIVQLLSDLLLKCIESGGKDNLYVGVLTVTRNSNSRFDLVDGQQRFTVMVLMGIVMKQYYTDWSDFILKDNKARLDFSARQNDCKYLIPLLKSELKGQEFSDFIDNHKPDGYVNSTMKEGLKTISDFICNIDKKKIDPESFSRYVYEHLSFFIDELPADYSARQMNKHFEVMNSTGRNLENHEILKVELLKEVPEENYGKLAGYWNCVSNMSKTLFPIKEKDKDNYAGIIANMSSAYDKLFSSENHNEGGKISDILEKGFQKSGNVSPDSTENSSQYHPFLTFSDFLLHVLYCILSKEEKPTIVYQHFFDPNELLTTFKEYVGKDKKITAEGFIKAMVEYRVLFDYYIIRIDGDGNYDLLATQSQDRSLLEQYEAMLYAGTSRYTYYQWIPFILNFVKQDKEKSIGKILQELKKNDIQYHPFDAAKLTYKTIDRYFFRRLDYYLWENRNNCFPAEQRMAVEMYRFRQYNSIEHFCPQNKSKQIIDISDDSANSFGNLALVSDSFNSIQSNDYLGVKGARIQEQIDKRNIESLKLVLMYNIAKYNIAKKNNGWNDKLIRDHGEQMVSLLENIYSKNQQEQNS